MKKKELVELIIETIYSELPDIISEIKSSLKEELIAEGQQGNGDDIRRRVREEFRKINPDQTKMGAPEGKNLAVEYDGEIVASGKGVLEWFAGQKGNAIKEQSEFKHSDKKLTDFMSKTFGKNIR